MKIQKVQVQKVIVNVTEDDMFIISHALSKCCDDSNLLNEMSVLFSRDEYEVTESLDKMIDVLSTTEQY